MKPAASSMPGVLWVACHEVNSGFRVAGLAVSVTIIQLCHCSIKAATDSMEIKGHGCVPVKLYL